MKAIAGAHFCYVVESPQVLDGAGKVQAVEGFAECAVSMTLKNKHNTRTSKVDFIQINSTAK